jgi:biotin carboxylase
VKPPHYLFVESNTTGTGALAVERLLDQGARVTFLARQPAKYPFLRARHPALAVREVETNDREALSGEIARVLRDGSGGGGVDALLTFSEFYVESVAEAARRFGFRYLSPAAARACRDKFETRKALRAAGLATPACFRVDSEAAALEAGERVGYPCVVKPPGDSSSKGVRLARDARELAEQFAAVHAWEVNDRGQRLRGEVLVESRLDGAEVSVETMTLAPGATHVIGITAKHLSPPPLFVELGHDFPAALEPEAAARIEAETCAALAAVGFDFGPAHTEIRWTAAGPVVVEINPRLAGGMIPELVMRARGIDLAGAWLAQLRGLPVDLAASRAEWASIRFFTADRAGRLAAVANLEAARAFATVREAAAVKEIGAPVRPAEEAADRVGYVIASGSSREQVAAEVEQAVRRIRVEVSPGLACRSHSATG